MLLSVHNDCCNLLIHEYENRSEQCWSDGNKAQPPRICAKRMNQPIPATPRGLKFMRHVQFGSFHTEHHIQDRHRRNGNDHGKVGDEAAEVGRKKVLKLDTV